MTVYVRPALALASGAKFLDTFFVMQEPTLNKPKLVFTSGKRPTRLLCLIDERLLNSYDACQPVHVGVPRHFFRHSGTYLEQTKTSIYDWQASYEAPGHNR